MSEDERYRTSTQYRLWSFSPSSLLALRKKTNQNAASRVREAVQRVREARVISSGDTSETEIGRANSAVPEGEVDCLTVEEELKLLDYYFRQTISLGDHLNVTSEVKATAVQYIKRFYLTNSLMTYSPADILKTALYFATKTESHYISLEKFANNIGDTKPEDVIASEFLLTQGLRFTFDVRHPFRPLEGAILDLQAIANANIPALPGGGTVGDRPARMDKRVKDAHGKARQYLKTSAILTDAYFHFTPSQIMMASLFLVDQELTTWYISSKFPSNNQASANMEAKVLDTVERCAEMLRTVSPVSEQSDMDKKEIKVLSKKLRKCRNPEKSDLVGLQRAKREGEDGNDEKVVKKRKMEREKNAREGEDLFGPEIKRE